MFMFFILLQGVESFFFVVLTCRQFLYCFKQCRFLHLLINHVWALEPLVVDVNGDLTPDDHIKIMVR